MLSSRLLLLPFLLTLTAVATRIEYCQDTGSGSRTCNALDSLRSAAIDDEHNMVEGACYNLGPLDKKVNQYSVTGCCVFYKGRDCKDRAFAVLDGEDAKSAEEAAKMWDISSWMCGPKCDAFP